MGPDAHRFAFLLHPLDDQSYADYDPSLSILNAGELREFAEQHGRNDIDPVLGSTVDIQSKSGARARGDFILLSHTAEQFRRLPQTAALAVLKAGLRLAIDRGARIVGLGAYTSVVSGGGVLLRDEGIPLTSGNSYTVVAGIEALDMAVHRTERHWGESCACIVGAAGAIGACMAILLARRVPRLVLVGNRHTSRRLAERACWPLPDDCPDCRRTGRVRPCRVDRSRDRETCCKGPFA